MNVIIPSSQWVKQAICRDDPDAMFPDKDAAKNAHAKRMCGGCPVRTICLVEALRTRDNEHGIRGGLLPDERRKVAAIVKDNYTDVEALNQAVQKVLHPSAAGRTLRDVWEERSYPLAGGHLGWRGGSSSFSFAGRVYTPKQISFLLDRGRKADGPVWRTCPVVECVHPRHLADGPERVQRQKQVEETARLAALAAEAAAEIKAAV